MAEIKIKHLYKIYDNDVKAVDDFNLEIKDKEFIVLVGPSGCGKSTTLRMIAGLEAISKGELYIGEKLVNNVAAKDRNIAMVFQNYALYPHMNVYENMAFGLKLRKMKKNEIKERVHNAAKILGLEEMLDRKPRAMSGGQRQRVALGRAIVRDPQLFLMDEPLSNLDAKLRVQMRSEIIKLHRRLQTTTIYVTHDQTEAMTMASRIVIMRDGVVQQVGTPKEVYELPKNMFVGGFIGSPAMNFLRGKLIDNSFKINDSPIEIVLPDNKLKLLRDLGYLNKEIILGIRPEHMEKKAERKYSTFSVTIDVAELMGAETLIYAKMGEQHFIAKLDSDHNYYPGEKIELAFNMEKAHFFDIETELRLE